jgi:hypothetical protein
MISVIRLLLEPELSLGSSEEASLI